MTSRTRSSGSVSLVATARIRAATSGEGGNCLVRIPIPRLYSSHVESLKLYGSSGPRLASTILRMAPPALTEIIDVVSRRLGASDETSVISRAGDDLPSVMFVHEKIGLVCVEVGEESEDTVAVRTRLNSKVSDLRGSVSKPEQLPLWRIAIVKSHSKPYEVIGETSIAVRSDSLDTPEWASHIRTGKPSTAALKEVRNKFRPANTFSVHRWVGAEDPKRAARTEVRVRLDEQQAKIAAKKVDDVMLLSGPPGSGKTLVLFARARLLAEENPDWKIVLVVYTKNLASSFREKSLDMPENVSILTIKEFLTQRNVGRFAEFIFPKGDDDAEEVAKKAEREFKLIRSYGIPQDVDAMMIDEWQDFPAPYLRYLFSTVRKNRGGTVLAGDERQSIFLDEPADESLKGHTVKRVTLKYPYRSTKEILAIAQALDDSAPKIDVGMALSGEPVSLVKCVNWMGQAEAIAREVRVLLDKGRRAGDIAVLVTKRTGARNYVCAALDAAGIPNVNLTAYWESPARSRSKVSVMTVHSAKGDEFQAVFVHGFEIIRPAPKSGVGKKWENVAYVAVTRAQDLLFIMHSKSEGFVPSLNNCSDSVLARRLYPDDYE